MQFTRTSPFSSLKKPFAAIVLVNLLFLGAIGTGGYFAVSAAYHAIVRDFGGK